MIEGRESRIADCGLRLARCAILAATLLALAGCATFATRPSSGPIEGALAEVAPASSTGLSVVFASEPARRKIATDVWQLIAERFYDPAMNGVDWPAVRERFVPRAAVATSDAAFYRELKAMAASLRDSHTQVLTPRETIDRRRFTTTRVGVMFGLIDGQLVITEGTVKNHVHNALEKLHLTNRVQAAAYAVRQGYANAEGRRAGRPSDTGPVGSRCAQRRIGVCAVRA